MNEQIDSIPTESSSAGFPTKPIVIEKNENALIRSLVSLFIYALLFYFLFERNVVYIAAVLLVIVIHEMGHFLLMRLFNYSNVKIFIVPLLGAFTAGKKQQVSQWQLSLIILAGPVPGILLGCLIYYLNRDLHNETYTMLSYTFLFINLLNLLPLFPLDGGRLIETLFFKDNFVIRLVFGIISILALMLIFVVTVNPILFVIPALIALELYNENKHEKIRTYLRQEKINYYTDYENLPNRSYWLIRDCLIFSFPKKYRILQPGKYEYSVIEPLMVQHISSVLKVNLKLDLSFVKRILVLLFYVVLFVAPLVMYLFLKYPAVGH
ncbi:MAG: site-2 protease family protein [bacterium]|nr:site-2 protease family protein [bacterium]